MGDSGHGESKGEYGASMVSELVSKIEQLCPEERPEGDPYILAVSDSGREGQYRLPGGKLEVGLAITKTDNRIIIREHASSGGGKEEALYTFIKEEGTWRLESEQDNPQALSYLSSLFSKILKSKTNEPKQLE